MKQKIVALDRKTYFIDWSGTGITPQVHDTFVLWKRVPSPAIDFVVDFEVEENSSICSSCFLTNNFEQNRVERCPTTLWRSLMRNLLHLGRWCHMVVLLGHTVLDFWSKIYPRRSIYVWKSTDTAKKWTFCDRILWLVVNLLRDGPCYRTRQLIHAGHWILLKLIWWSPRHHYRRGGRRWRRDF